MHGSNNGLGGTPFQDCDLINDCSDSLHEQWFVQQWNVLNDKLWLQFSVTAPEGVHGYMFDFAFFSSEFPDFVNTQFNDMFVAWSSSETYTGNLTFIGEAPMNTTSLAAAGAFDYMGEAEELYGTGFETHGATPRRPGRRSKSPCSCRTSATRSSGAWSCSTTSAGTASAVTAEPVDSRLEMQAALRRLA